MVNKLIVHSKKNLKAVLGRGISLETPKRKKFRGRQHSINNFIVDFYCAEEKLIVELDGEVHWNPAAERHDIQRTKELEELGYRVVQNKMVFENLASVLM